MKQFVFFFLKKTPFSVIYALTAHQVLNTEFC